MQNVELQLLQSGDIAEMRELNAMFARAFSDSEAYLSNPPGNEYLEAWLANESNIALIALDAGTLAGGLVAFVLDKFEQARREIYIYDLAVAEEFRRRGIASALIRRLQEIAKDIGAWVIYVQADYGDDPAIALYQKMGVREEVLHFDIAVAP
jgi:aminoglycoside 3-N-acetyltransferase I